MIGTGDIETYQLKIKINKKKPIWYGIYVYCAVIKTCRTIITINLVVKYIISVSIQSEFLCKAAN